MTDQDEAADRTGASSPGPDRDEDFEFLVESRLTGFGCYLTDFAETRTGYELTYESIATDQSGTVPHREVGRIVNVFRDVEDDPVAIDATVTDMDGTPMGAWHAEYDWMAALEAGDMTELEFSDRVVDSIEPVARD